MSLARADVEKLKVDDLKKELTALGLDIKGLKKAELQAKLIEYIDSHPTTATATNTTPPASATTTSPNMTVPASTSAVDSSATVTSPTTASATTTTSTNGTVDISKMTQQERMIYRAEKFKTAVPAANNNNTTATTTATATATATSTTPSSPSLTSAEKVKQRRERFAATTATTTSTDGTTTTTHKVKQTKIDQKTELLGSQQDILARKKKFGGTESNPLIPENDDVLNRRLKRFSNPQSTSTTTDEDQQ